MERMKKAKKTKRAKKMAVKIMVFVFVQFLILILDLDPILKYYPVTIEETRQKTFVVAQCQISERMTGNVLYVGGGGYKPPLRIFDGEGGQYSYEGKLLRDYNANEFSDLIPGREITIRYVDNPTLLHSVLYFYVDGDIVDLRSEDEIFYTIDDYNHSIVESRKSWIIPFVVLEVIYWFAVGVCVYFWYRKYSRRKRNRMNRKRKKQAYATIYGQKDKNQ